MGKRGSQLLQGGRVSPLIGSQREQRAGRLAVVSRLGDRFVDRIDRLLPVVDRLLLSLHCGQAVGEKGARLAVPGVVDLSDLSDSITGVAKVILEQMQELLLKVTLQLARDDWENRRERQRQGICLAQQEGKYKGRRANKALHGRIVALRKAGQTIAETARLAGCSEAQVKRVWAVHRAESQPLPQS